MKSRVEISVCLTLMLVTIGWDVASQRGSIIPVAAAVSNQISNGQILQIRGNVQLKRSPGRVIHATTGTRLYQGDKLLAATGGQALIQCADSTIQSVNPGEERSNSCPDATPKAECTPGTYKCPHRGDEIAWTEGIPYIISPRRTAILEDKPMLRWNSVPGAKRYTVNVEGDGVNWTKQVSATQVVYSGQPPLKPGSHYLLSVMADTGASSVDEPVRPGGLHFSRLDANQSKRVQVAANQIAQQKWTNQAKALALANLYTENGLIADAIATLEKLVEGGTQTAPIYRTLGDLYLNYLVLVPQASTYYSKAVQLLDPEDVEERTAAQAGLERVQQALGNRDKSVR